MTGCVLYCCKPTKGFWWRKQEQAISRLCYKSVKQMWDPHQKTCAAKEAFSFWELFMRAKSAQTGANPKNDLLKIFLNELIIFFPRSLSRC